MSTRLWKVFALIAAIAGGVLTVVLVMTIIDGVTGGDTLPTRVFVMLAIVDGFLGHAAVVLFAARRVIASMVLSESRRTAAYMKGVRDTLMETGLSMASTQRGEASANGHLRSV